MTAKRSSKMSAYRRGSKRGSENIVEHLRQHYASTPGKVSIKEMKESLALVKDREPASRTGFKIFDPPEGGGVQPAKNAHILFAFYRPKWPNFKIVRGP